MAYVVADIYGGPLDGMEVPVDPEVMVYWCLPEPVRLVANDKSLPYAEMAGAVGMYARHSATMNRKRRDLLIWMDK